MARSVVSDTRSAPAIDRKPPAAPSRWRGIFLIVISSIAFGSAGVCGKAAMTAAGGDLSPLRLAQFRITGGAIVLLLFVYAQGRRTGVTLRWTPSMVRAVVAYGLIAFVGVQAFYFLAISRMPVGIALLIEYLAPALVALWAVLVQRRKQNSAVWMGIALAVVGLVLIARPWAGFDLDGLGVFAALAAAVTLAAYFLIAESVGDRIPALPLAGWACAAGAIALAVAQPWWTFPWAVLSRPASILGGTVPVWVLLIVVVLVGTVFAYATGIAALRHLSSPVAAVLATIEVVVASIAAWILLGEHLSLVDISGGAVLLVGAVLAGRRKTAA